MTIFSLIWLLVALPLAGAAVLLLGGRRTDKWGHLLGCATVIAAFALGFAMFITMLGKPADSRSFTQHLYTWISVGSFHVDASLLIDQLSISFVLLITGVGALIHVYSVGYMANDPDRRRFFGYLNLFVAAMLLLVLGANYLVLYAGWEGVGLASYLLIGFWQFKPTAAVAAKKAFVVNRVGDIGMSLGIMLIFATFGTLNFGGVFAGAKGASSGVLLAIGLLLLLAACGKSAQFPLQSWLLDAMEGPTPVSALIHAATMVTAGVYLIVRSGPLFDLSHGARIAVVVIGTITLLFGAIIGCAKDDIKKALAGSTMSQIGYMFLAAGLGPVGYVFAIFHLLTHGFFKAGLFLGAGSVMHSMNDEVNMRRYGMLRKAMVVTTVCFFLGYLAIIGIPPFSGFWSKDEIIHASFSQGWVVGVAAMIGAAITAFYMTRVVVMTFFSEKRWADDAHPHESPVSMTVPMMLLAVGSVCAGYIGWQNNRIIDWLSPVTGFQEGTERISEVAVSTITLVLVLAGGALGAYLFGFRAVPTTAPEPVNPVITAARRDLYGDAFNETVLMRPGQWLTRVLVYLDNKVIDGAVNGLAAMFGGMSARARRVQTGYARSYATSMVLGAILLVLIVVLVRV
jgi:NADH-quinone oxidoreductase subunit L